MTNDIWLVYRDQNGKYILTQEDRDTVVYSGHYEAAEAFADHMNDINTSVNLDSL
jgi:hypothetical protein